MPSIAIGFAGPIGAGKTTGAQYLSDEFGFQYVRYSQILAEWFPRKRDAHKSLQAAGLKVMLHQQQELNRRLIAKIAPGRDVAVDGLRHITDAASLRTAIGAGFFLFYVEAPRELRWARKRDSGHFKTEKEFDEADRHPVEQPRLLLLERAAAIIWNTGPIESYYAALRSSVEQRTSRGIGGFS